MTKMNRRSFLQGTSVAALTAMLPSVSGAAPPTLRAPKRAVAPVVTTGFNGGRSQVNLNFPQWGGDYPFLNCFKTAQQWSLCDNSGPPEPNTLDGDGYPLSISRGGVYTVHFVPSQAARPG